MKRSVENWYYNLKLNENWRSYATLKLSYLKIMEVAISTRLEPAVMLLPLGRRHTPLRSWYEVYATPCSLGRAICVENPHK